MSDNQPTTALVGTHAHNPMDLLLDVEAGRSLLGMADKFAKSGLVPKHMAGNVSACFVALVMAHQLQDNPLVVMQNMFTVHGTPGWSAKYQIARANRSGIFKGRINWREEGKGDSLSVTAYARLAETDEEVSFTCDMAMARAEEWTKNSKYKSMPALMLRYRSATFLIRLYAPEVMLGQTAEEVEDIHYARSSVTQAPTDPMLGTPVEDVVDADLEPTPGAPDEAMPNPEPLPVASIDEIRAEVARLDKALPPDDAIAAREEAGVGMGAKPGDSKLSEQTLRAWLAAQQAKQPDTTQAR